MPDATSAYPPPPPPPNVAPPVYQGPPGQPMPAYTPPPVSQPPAGYPLGWQQQPQPWQHQPQPAVGAGWGTVGIVSQFSGSAMWACIAGLVTIVVPFAFGRVYFFLPIIGIITGIRAIRAGKLIGGIVGIALSAIGGLITIVALTTPG